VLTPPCERIVIMIDHAKEKIESVRIDGGKRRECQEKLTGMSGNSVVYSIENVAELERVDHRTDCRREKIAKRSVARTVPTE